MTWSLESLPERNLESAPLQGINLASATSTKVKTENVQLGYPKLIWI